MSTLTERLGSLTPQQRALFELRLRERNASPPRSILPVPRVSGQSLPVSFAQQRLWFLHQLQPESPLYNTFLTVALTGPLNTGALERALAEIVRRNEVLRTTFSHSDGTPVQCVHETVALPLHHLVLNSRPEEDRLTVAREAVREEIRRPFDLERGPVIRALLVRIASEHHILALTMHHIVSDRWSIDVLTRDVAALYSAFSRDAAPALEPLPIQYADFALWQRSPQRTALLERQLAWWRQTLRPPLPVADLPFDRPRPAIYRSDSGVVSATLSSATVDALIRIGHPDGATLFMTMLAASAILLFRHTGQTDVVVGTPIVNRAAPETAPLIGCFVNTLALRLDGWGNPTWREFQRRVRAACLDAYERQDVPFERLVEELQPDRSLSQTPLFQVMFALNDAHEPLHGGGVLESALIANGLTLSPFEVEHGNAAADLTIRIERSARLTQCSFEYRTELFDNSTVVRMVRRFETLLEAIAAEPGRRLNDLPALTPEERRQVLIEWSRTTAPDSADTSIDAMVSLQARIDPGAPAVSGSQSSLTRGGLDLRARQLAALLRERGAAPDTIVGVFMDRTPEMIGALLGVLYAGAAYLPLDPSYPVERLAWILNDSGASLLLTTSNLAGKLAIAVNTVLVIDTVLMDREAAIDACVPLPGPILTDPENLAYVIYTSGSTGRPKGVAVRRRGLLNLVTWHIARYQLGPQDRTTQLAALGFDASAWEIWPALASGAELFLAQADDRLSAERVWSWLCDRRITTTFLPTPLAEAVLALNHRAPSTLRLMLTGGDRLRSYPSAPLEFALVNHYGPTEYTVVTTAGDPIAEAPTNDGARPPIGRPIAHTNVFVLDDSLSPAPPGVRGELYVGGEGLARGYLGRADLTAERFIPHPFSNLPGARLYRTGDSVRYRSDGELEFLRRNDAQVKIRGFRVELTEIEAVLAAHASVREAAVIVRDGPHGDSVLVGFAVARTGSSPKSEELRDWMLNHLPAYMVPAVCVLLEELPLSANGKLDRQALAAVPLQPRQAGPTPRTPHEQAIAEIWMDVLGCDCTGVHDDFFELGGHSLLATQLVSRIRSCLGVEVPLRDAFVRSTIAGMAGRIQELQHAEGGLSRPPLIARFPAEPPPLSFAQRRLWFIAQLEPQSPAYNIPFAVRFRGEFSIDAARRAMSQIVHRHETLRSRFLDREGQAALEIAAPVALSIALHDLSAGAREQREIAAHRWCADEAVRPFDLAAGPPLRAALLQLDAHDHILVLTLHHIAADGWSVGVLAREFATLYRAFREEAPSSLPELAVQFSDYAAWQSEWLRGRVMDNLVDHWRAKLDGAATLQLAYDCPRPSVPSYRAAAVPFAIQPNLWSALQRISRDQGATGFMLLFAGWALLLSRYSGQSDIVVGTDIAGRDQVETEGLIGLFVNQLALRLTIDPADTFRTLLRRAREVMIDAYSHQSLPFEVLVEALAPDRDLSRHPLFQCKLALEEAPPALNLPGVEASLFAAGHPTIKTDLRLAARFAGGGVEGRIEFALDLFEPATIERMAVRFVALLTAAAAAPDDAVATLPLIDDRERQRILSLARGPEEKFPSIAIHELFERRAAEIPDETAVLCEGRRWSYFHLNERANDLAGTLIELGAGPEVRVGLCLERSDRAILALLAVLKAGAAYVPMDPAFPSERLATLAKAANVSILLTVRRWCQVFEGGAARILCLDDDTGFFPLTRLPVKPRVEPANLAYVIFTSGSTGTPKAVGVEHRNLVNYVLAVSAKLQPVRGRRFALLSTLAADLGNTTLFASLAGGGVLHVIPEELASDPDALAAYFHEHSIECVKIAPSHLASLLSARSPAHALPSALLILGGEASSWAWIRQLRALRPECRILNHYGPTEATVGALTADISSHAGAGALSIPLGTPLANMRAYVLDETGQIAPDGIPGELYLGGAGVARGYLDAPAQTAERFRPDPFGSVPGARLYSTGDRARSIGDGIIEFLGRTDRQVKIRGFRVERGEIEAVLNQHPGIARSAVAVIEDGERGARVAAWFAPLPGHAPATRDLRNFLEQRLPAYMVPAAFVLLERLPLLANGKLDWRALPEPRFGDHSGEPSTAFRTPTEEIVAGIWQSVLGVGPIAPTHNFFELGGHSLLATRVASRVREAFGISLGVRAVFECRTLAEFASRVDSDRVAAIGIAPPPLVPRPRDGQLPLSFAEQRLWFLQRFAPEDRSYLVPIVLRLSGELSSTALQAAFSETVRRHEILRTCFPSQGDLPVRFVRPAAPCPLPLADLRVFGSKGELELRCRIEVQLDQPFDLAVGPLLRTALYRTGDSEHVLLILLHHIISDAWSSGVLLAEMGALYQTAGLSPLPPLAIQYADFACWQRDWLRGQALDELLDWWRIRLVGAPPLELPVDRRPGSRSTRGASCSIMLDPVLTQALKACARTAGVTDFVALLAALATLLARFSGQTDISIGTPVSGRIHAALEPLLGCFVNILALRCILDGDPTFAELLSRLRETTLAAWDRQELPFEKLVEHLQPSRTLQSTPLFQVMFVHQNAPDLDPEFGGIRFQQVAFETRTAKFDLTLMVRELRNSAGDVSYAARLEYRTDLFEHNTIVQMLASFRCLLSSAVQDPGQRLSALSLFDAGQRETLLGESRSVALYSREYTVGAVFADRAIQMPDAVALHSGGIEIRYAELDRRANRLAHHLRSLGVGPEVLVAVYMDRSAELIVTLLAVLKAGAAYVPLDPSDPTPRLAFVLADTGASVAVTESHLADRILTAGAATLVVLDRDVEIIAEQLETPPDVCVTGDHLAYVMYTSGSTGTPKGVAVPHRAILRLVNGNDYAAMTSADVFLQLAPAGFDASTFEIWGALLNGATLVLFPSGVPSLPELGEFLIRHRISTLWLTAGLFRLMVDEQIASLRGVRQLLAGGDVLPVPQVRRVLEELPGCRLINGYGPTENTTFTCCHTVKLADLEAASIPIGRPIANTEAFVLDENMQLLPAGARGELYAGGDGLARGYRARPDLTAERFVPHPFSSLPGARLYRTGDSVRRRADGTIEFLGRKDGQIKIRGFRVEIGEIEAVLCTHPAVREAAVVVRDGVGGDRLLAAFIAQDPDSPPETAALSDWLRQRLPNYMMPSIWVTMAQLPLTANGKIDRRALAVEPLGPSELPEEYVAPSTPDQQALAAIWSDILGRERIGVHSNFFELGGHSLLATQLSFRIERELGIAVPLRLIFESATIAELAETLEVLRWMAGQEEGA